MAFPSLWVPSLLSLPGTQAHHLFSGELWFDNGRKEKDVEEKLKALLFRPSLPTLKRNE